MTQIVARSPSKLIDSLFQRGLSEPIIRDHLTITEGTVTDLDAVRRTIQPGVSDSPMVDIIVSGLGGKMLFSNPLRPTLDNPTICQDGVRTILDAARQFSDSNQKPTLIVLSTTGISDAYRDVPFAMMPMYYWMLRVPHEDKRAMETLILNGMVTPVEGREIDQYTIVRRSTFTEGTGDGLTKIKAGVEDKSAVGYFIARKDVGKWVFEMLVNPGLTSEYLGKVVSIAT